MNLPKAIELNKDSEKSLRNHKFIDHADAILLSIEAIKALQIHRTLGYPALNFKLPGETEK